MTQYGSEHDWLLYVAVGYKTCWSNTFVKYISKHNISTFSKVFRQIYILQNTSSNVLL